MAITSDDVRRAELRMAELRERGHAVAARYDLGAASIVVSMSTGLEVAFATRLAEGLALASAAELADVEVSASGLGLHWPRLDADLSVPALMQGVFGGPRWMARLRADGEIEDAAPIRADGELYRAVERVLAKAEDVLGSRGAALRFLREPCMALDQTRPADVLRTPEGVERVLRHLRRLDLGVYT